MKQFIKSENTTTNMRTSMKQIIELSRGRYTLQVCMHREWFEVTNKNRLFF